MENLGYRTESLYRRSIILKHKFGRAVLRIRSLDRRIIILRFRIERRRYKLTLSNYGIQIR